MINWVEIIETKREEISAALLRQWENALDESPGDDLRQHAVELHEDGSVFEYLTGADQLTKDIRYGKSILIHKFEGARKEGDIDEYYAGDTQAWIKDMKNFHELDSDEIISDVIDERIKIEESRPFIK